MGPSSCIEIALVSAEVDLELLSQSYLNNRAYVHASQNVTSVAMSRGTKHVVSSVGLVIDKRRILRSWISRLSTTIIISYLYVRHSHTMIVSYRINSCVGYKHTACSALTLDAGFDCPQSKKLVKLCFYPKPFLPVA